MQTVQISNKLTVAEMGLDKATIQQLLADKKEGETLVIARMFGKTSKYDEKPSKLDATRNDVAFKGEFEGHNLITGEVFNAPKAYLPGAAEAATKNAIDNLEDGQSVVFGCDIAVKKQSSSAVGYVFGVSVPKQPTAQDPLAEIREAMGGLPTRESVPQIEAPKPIKGKSATVKVSPVAE